MKNIMIIIDGMNDDSIEELFNMTPYEYASPKHMEYMKARGSCGLLTVSYTHLTLPTTHTV